MDVLMSYFVCKKSQLALATPTGPIASDTLSTDENRQVLNWSITSTESLYRARGWSTHRSYATALNLQKLRRQKAMTSVIYTSENSYDIR